MFLHGTFNDPVTFGIGPTRARELRASVGKMRKHYDFSRGRRNPYAARLKKQITIRLDQETVRYFKGLSADTGIPYQTLINLYLRECAASRKKLAMRWGSAASSVGA